MCLLNNSKIPNIVLLQVFLLFTLLVGPAEALSKRKAFFEIGFYGSKEKIVVQVRDPETVKEARNILKAKERRSVIGEIIKRKASYNPKWNFYIKPVTVSFFEVSIEDCDLSPLYLKRNLNRVGKNLLPDNIWCPWNSYLSRELHKK